MTRDQMIDKLNGYIQTLDEIIRSCGPDANGARAEYIKTMAEVMKVRVMMSAPGAAAAPAAPAATVPAFSAHGAGQKQFSPPITMAQAQAIIASGCPKCSKPVTMRVSQKTGKPYLACSANAGQNKTCDYYNGIAG